MSKFTSSFKYRWVILGVCFCAYMVAFMQRLSIGPLVPFLKEDLNLTSAQAGLFMSAAAFGYMLTVIPAGWLVDRIGVRWLLLIGEIFGGIFIISMFFVDSFTQGLIIMSLAGMGMGCIFPASTKGVLVWFPAKERATAMGIKQTAVNLGGIVTATTLPTVALALSWHYGFLGIGFIAIVIGIVSFILYKNPPLSATIGTTESMEDASSEKPSVLEIFKNRNIWLVIGVGMCLMVVEFAAIAYFVAYLEEILLFYVVTAGFLLAVLEAGGAFGKPVSGLLSDRLFGGNRRGVFILMCAITCAMCLVFAFLPQGSPIWLIVLFCIILGFVAIGWGGLHLTLIGEFAGRELAGTVSGASSAFLLLANMVGPPVFGHIVDITGSYQLAWIFLAALALLAVILLFFVQESRKRI